MTPCCHVCGHSSKSLGRLCTAYRRAHVVRNAPVDGVNASRLLVNAYEAETENLEANMNAAADALEAFTDQALAYLDRSAPAKGHAKDSPLHTAAAALRKKPK